ncbi:MAG: hypothetical protein JWP80_326, partial [Pseudomonas sp.]|nr:hypothetical protein [Pseudomonas sp.]
VDYVELSVGKPSSPNLINKRRKAIKRALLCLHDGGYPKEMEFVMSDYSYKHKPLLIAVVLALTATTAGPVNAMSFLNAEEHQSEAATSVAPELEPAATMPLIVPWVLPDKLNTIVDRLESDTDIKYYSFTAVRGQDVSIKLIGEHSYASPWLIQYQSGDYWATAVAATPVVRSGLKLNEVTLVRVLKNPASPTPVNTSYSLELGSAPHVTSLRYNGDAPDLPNRYPKLQVFKEIQWSVRVADSTGYPVEDVPVIVEIDKDEIRTPWGYSISEEKTGSAGQLNSSINLGKCSSTTKSAPFWTGSGKYTYRWELEFNEGYVHIYIKKDGQSAKDTKDGTRIPLMHVCKQRMLS